MLNMRKPKGSVQPNPVRVVRHMALCEAAPPSEPLMAAVVVQPWSFHPGQSAGRPESRVSGGVGREPEEGPGVAALAVVYPLG